MAEFRERSGLFKFFYIVLRVITFPLFAVLYVLKHPLAVTVLLAGIAGMALYYPLSEGKTFAEVPEWYKNKYDEMRLKAVKNLAVAEGTGLLSGDLQREVEDADRYKGENYNKKIVREDKVEEKTAELKRRGGFKRKKAGNSAEAAGGDDKESVLNQSSGTVGGLAEVLKGYGEKEEAKEKAEPDAAEKAAVSVPEAAVIKEDILPAPVSQNSGITSSSAVKSEEEFDEFDLF